MNYIEQMLTGEMEMPVFLAKLKSDAELQDEVRRLVPEDALNNREHPLWKGISYGSFKNNDFDMLKVLSWICQFDGSIGDNLNVFGIIKCVYCFRYPETKCTTKYSDMFDLYLSAVRDCFEGPEVRHITERIIEESIPHKTKAARLRQAKTAIEEQFHVVNKKYPRWIQGPEWPMGLRSPMAFVSQKRNGECVRYFFEDVDTKEHRAVEQFY